MLVNLPDGTGLQIAPQTVTSNPQQILGQKVADMVEKRYGGPQLWEALTEVIKPQFEANDIHLTQFAGKILPNNFQVNKTTLPNGSVELHFERNN